MNIQILPYNKAPLPALKHLWLTCFDDTAEYVDFFFENRLPPSLSVVAATDNELLGAAYLLPAYIRDAGILRPAFYLYALGVAPTARNMGIGRSLLEQSFAFAEERDAVIFLRPATAELIRYYEKAGMCASHYAKVVDFRPTEDRSGTEICPLTPELCYTLWELASTKNGSVFWTPGHVRYALAENQMSGGFALADPVNGSFAIGHLRDSSLLLTECFSPEPASFLAALCKQQRAAGARVRFGADASEADASPLVMTYNMHRPQSAPLGLLLDGPLEDL
ncbi:MAG: GNAT family N-acetyltransferase [Clostridia bacterium]|nr:GNAT family N-acetyltransferase [Clostridia bacterium]